MDSVCCSGVKGQHDLKSLPAGDGDLDEILFHLAKIVASDFVRSKIKIMLTDQRGFLNPSDPSRQNLRFMKVRKALFYGYNIDSQRCPNGMYCGHQFEPFSGPITNYLASVQHFLF